MKKKSEHQRTVARARKALAPLTPCIHVDADGYCTGCNEGALCVKCADYTAKTEEEIRESAVATIEPAKVPLTEDQAANAIRQQYQVVIRAEAATFRERVRFGGMLLSGSGSLASRAAARAAARAKASRDGSRRTARRSATLPRGATRRWRSGRSRCWAAARSSLPRFWATTR